MNLAIDAAAARSRPAELLAAGGPAGVVTVAGGGATGALFAWYAYLTAEPHPGALLEVTLLLALVLGPLVALWLWSAYSAMFARRCDIPYERALRWDALPWACLFVLWAIVAAPASTGSVGRTAALAVALACIAKLLIAARFHETVRDVLMTFVVTRVSIVIIAELAATIISQRPGQHFAASSSPILAVWGRWDAEHYIGIATSGYSGTEPAFFPLYPLLIRLLGGAISNHLVAGLVVSNAASFFALLYLYRLIEHEYNRQVAHRAIFYVSIFPTAIFFSAVYTESLFLFLTVASFYYTRERRWLAAGAFGYFAALTRVEGVLLAVPFVIEWAGVLAAQRGGARRRPFDTVVKPLLGVALIPLGLATYMAYLWVLLGDPLYFSHVQAHWGRHLGMPWVSFWHSFSIIFGRFPPQTIANQLLELTFTLLMLGMLIAGWRRLRPSYVAYMGLSILVPMSTSSLMSMPRFALVLFPMFVLFGLWGAKPNVNNAIVAFSLPLLGLFTVLFADWYWVA